MIQGRIKRKIYFSICGIFSVLNNLIKKNNKLIFFFSTSELYDNSAALFYHLVHNKYNSKYRIVCAVRKPKNYLHLKYKNVKFINVYFSVWYILHSKFIFYHNEIIAIKPSKKQISIDFWHATTVKKINKMIDPHYKYDFFTYITVTSELFRPIFAQAFGCNLERIIINGHPRNDYLFDSIDELHKLLNQKTYKRVFIWMPTYRLTYNYVWQDTDEKFLNETGLPLLECYDDLNNLNTFLLLNSCFLIIKIHPTQNMNYQYNNLSNINYLFNEDIIKNNINLYSLLKQMDALITDYSSVYYDFLLLNKPIAFTIDDIEAYSKKRGFVFDEPMQYMPGEKVRNLNDLYTFIKNCINDIDNFKEERRVINELVNEYKDGNNCRRILDIAGINLLN